VAQVIEHLSSKIEALSSNCSTIKKKKKKKNPQIYSQVIFNKGAMPVQWEKERIIFPTNSAGTDQS
jgi:competence protein ComGF